MQCTPRPIIDSFIIPLLVRLGIESDTLQCTVLAAAVIGSFSWDKTFEAYWLSPACWHCSLVLSVLGILVSTQQSFVLETVGPPPTENTHYSRSLRKYLPLVLTQVLTSRQREDPQREGSAEQRILYAPRWKMVFTWQCPTMFMSYSVCLFLLGLTIYVCTPLIRGDNWGDGDRVSFFLVKSFVCKGYNANTVLR